MKRKPTDRITVTSPDRLPTPPRRKLKRPDGVVVEEFVIDARHTFHGGRLIAHSNEPEGYYTGRIYFLYPDGSETRWYTVRSAPQWLRALWEEATRAE